MVFSRLKFSQSSPVSKGHKRIILTMFPCTVDVRFSDHIWMICFPIFLSTVHRNTLGEYISNENAVIRMI